MGEPLSAQLRAATADLHRRVEDGVDILRRTESVAGTVELMLRMEAFYRTLEPRLARSLKDVVPADYLAPRSPRLRADLDLLAPEWHSLPEPTLPAGVDGLGALYVLEGAALGGQIIARHLEARLGFRSVFFGGEGVGPRWRGFRAVLDASEDKGAIESATATFLSFENTVVVPPLSSLQERGTTLREAAVV